jgi:hypothetical protein
MELLLLLLASAMGFAGIRDAFLLASAMRFAGIRDAFCWHPRCAFAARALPLCGAAL